jgi:hypothetical protein
VTPRSLTATESQISDSREFPLSDPTRQKARADSGCPRSPLCTGPFGEGYCPLLPRDGVRFPAWPLANPPAMRLPR